MKYRYGKNVFFSTQIIHYRILFKRYIEYKIMKKIIIFTDNCDANVSLLKQPIYTKAKTKIVA